MCGLAGIAHADGAPVPLETLSRMAAAVRHRGPDGYGFSTAPGCGLAHVRLSIVDLACGAQPIANEDGRLLAVFNGEIFNFIELRRDLEARGHRFATQTDTEVLVHGYEEWGADMLERLNGQFAIAIHDRRDGSLFLARDRYGVRPLFYAVRRGSLYFASEAKALFASGAVEAAPDLEGLDEVFTFWAARAPRTVFRGVSQLEPGSRALWRGGRLSVSRWFEPAFAAAPAEPAGAPERLGELLDSSVAFRLRADVPVGGYLSGGLDSSIICALAAKHSPHDLRTFSVTFADPLLDESAHQKLVAEAIGSRHAVQHIGGTEIAAVFPDVVAHTETPLLRTAPAPMYLLAKLTRERGITVVLTGEGSDEIFLGYDLFKEVVVRQFCLRQPGSRVRPRLFDRLYPYLAPEGRAAEFWRRSFLDAGPPSDPLFSHLPRIRNAVWIKSFYSGAVRDALGRFDAAEELRAALPPAFASWSPLERADYLEITTLLPGYLLSSQGDRVAMAHGVEGRYPFLDHRVASFAASLPTRSRLRGLREKDILRRWAAGVVPPVVNERPKQPYRAPDAPAFFGNGQPEYVRELLEPGALAGSGLFDPAAVQGLRRRAVEGRITGSRENQALVGILSAELWHRAFCRAAAPGGTLPLDRADVCLSSGTIA